MTPHSLVPSFVCILVCSLFSIAAAQCGDGYTCRDGSCIPTLFLRCDTGLPDCADGSDEDGCDVCPYFLCDNMECTDLKADRCDGKLDCSDGSDEVNCSLSLMEEMPFPGIPPPCRSRNVEGNPVLIEEGQIIVGEVEEELNVGPPLSEYYTRDSGLYLLLEPVPKDGIITRMRALGILSDRDYELYMRNRLNPLDVSMYLFFAVFRLDTDSGSYHLIHGPEMATHTLLKPAVAKSLEWPVRAGDKIGAVIPDSCFNGTKSPPFPCPSRFNFRVPENHCFAGLYSPVNMSSVDDMDLAELLDGIPIDQFVEEQVLLNVEAEINTDSGATSSGALIGGVVAAAIAGIILVLTVTILIILVWKTWSKRNAGPYYSYIPQVARAVGVNRVMSVPHESLLSSDPPGAFPDSVKPQQLRDDPEIATINMVRNKAYEGSAATVIHVGTSIRETEMAQDNIQDETAEVNSVSMIRNSAYGRIDGSDGGASLDTGIDMDTKNCVEASACVDAGSDTDMKMVENAAYRIDISIDAPAHSGVFAKSNC